MRRILLLSLVFVLATLACSLTDQVFSGTSTPTAPSVTETPTPDPNRAHLELTIEPANPRVGELVTVTAKTVGLGLPYYYFMVQDEGAVDPSELGRVTYNNEAAGQEGASQIVQFVQAEGSMDQAIFTLLTLAPGTTTLWVNATGEVQTPEGAWTWSGGGSEPIVLTIDE